MRKSDTRERILDEAFKLIGKKGLSGFSMRELASKVGITEAAIYRHFPSKEELLVCVIKERLRKVIPQIMEELFRKLSEEGTLKPLADFFISGQLPFEEHMPKLRSLILESYSWGGNRLKRALVEVLRELHFKVAEAVKFLQERGLISSELSPRAIAFVLITMKNSMLFTLQLREDVEAECVSSLTGESWLLDERGRREVWEVLERALRP